MRTIGIAAHSFEGGALCFLTACREGSIRLGPHMHPSIVLSAVPMGLSLQAWETHKYSVIAEHLTKGIKQITDAGAEFYICPDNTAHLVLETIASSLPIPGLHIADVVCSEILAFNWKKVGLLGTKWTMTGSVYEKALARRNLEKIIPNESVRASLNSAIFEELCQGIISKATTAMFLDAIDQLKNAGAECVILGCTEIPLIVNSANSPLPILDSTRLLAKYAVIESLKEPKPLVESGWIELSD